MTFDTIYKTYTDIVNDYLSEGYTFHLSSMRGHQGEIGKVDLYKGEELIRVWLTKEYRSYFNQEEGEWSGDLVVLYVGKWMYPLQQVGSDRTVWMSDFTILQKREYYKVSRRDGWYLDNLDEALETVKVRKSRVRYNSNLDVTHLYKPEATQIGVKYLKRALKYQRVSPAFVTVSKSVNRITGQVAYRILYRDKGYTLK